MASSGSMENSELYEVRLEDPISGRSTTIQVTQEEFDRLHTDMLYAEERLSRSLNSMDGENGLPSTNMESAGPSKSSTGRWTDDATKLLLSTYESNISSVVNGHKKKKALWQVISEKLREQNCQYTPVQVENRWKYLEAQYKDVVFNNNTSGQHRKTCTYYNELQNLLGHKHNVQPLSVASSISGFRILPRASTSRNIEIGIPTNEESSSNPSTPKSVSSLELDVDECLQQTNCLITPRVGSRKRKSSVKEEPDWFKIYRMEVAERHKERMVMKERELELRKEEIATRTRESDIHVKELQKQGQNMQQFLSCLQKLAKTD